MYQSLLAAVSFTVRHRAPDRLAFCCVLCAVVSLLWSCNSGSVITRPQDVIFPDSNVSYIRHVDPLLHLGCAFAGCHTSTSAIPMDSYIALFQTPGLVIPGKPESSTFSQVVTGQLSHGYPLNNIVTENHKKGVATWIREGAKNN